MTFVLIAVLGNTTGCSKISDKTESAANSHKGFIYSMQVNYSKLLGTNNIYSIVIIKSPGEPALRSTIKDRIILCTAMSNSFRHDFKISEANSLWLIYNDKIIRKKVNNLEAVSKSFNTNFQEIEGFFNNCSANKSRHNLSGTQAGNAY
jgi:hypothetical protein